MLVNLPAAKGDACSVKSHYEPYCAKCLKERACADVYHLTYGAEADSCSATDLAVYQSMFHHLYGNRAYGLPVADKVSFCDVDDSDDDDDKIKGSYKPLMLYYQWGPSCNDGETFEMYSGGQSGFCYCGANCDKSYSNPPMNALLTTLVVIIAANIVFNVVVLLYRYQDNRQKSADTIKGKVTLPMARSKFGTKY
tara:strand:- start:356 stop:940 length:585 start_codon:yes stop_codon:yes gene_type:complete